MSAEAYQRARPRPPRVGLRFLAVVLVVCTMLAGCRHGSEGEQGQARFGGNDPCVLIKPIEVEMVLGAEAGKAKDPTTTGAPAPIEAVGMRFCQYRTAADTFVSFGLTSSFGRQVLDKYVERSEGEVTAVHGLGDEALWDGLTLLTRKGEHVFAIRVSSTGTNVFTYPKERATRLAVKALERL